MTTTISRTAHQEKGFGVWSLQFDDGLAILAINDTRQRQNTLSTTVIEDLARALDALPEQSVHGLIIRSDGPGVFIAGAEVSEFQKLESEQQALDIAQTANRIFNRIENLTYPSVAIINGHCLGGGLELALCCDYRVALDDPEIRIGLPEVRLGIHPGFGGTVRLPEIIGVPKAMDLILSGRTVSSYSAKNMGIVDYCVPERQLLATAGFVLSKRPPPKRAGRLSKVLSMTPVRQLMAKYLRNQVSRRVNQDHYPAPGAVIDFWENAGGNRSALFAAEQRSVAKLLVSDTSKNLVKVFYLQEGLKQTGREADAHCEHVHVIGAGVMGGDIAAWCALRGMRVSLQDKSEQVLAHATRRAFDLFKKKLRQPRLVSRTMDRFIPDLKGQYIANADIIIEAISENLQAKQSVFSAVEKQAGKHAILATNTSSIPIESIAQSLSEPGRLVGIHFFNPVAKMQLVEIVRGVDTDDNVVEWAQAFTTAINRLPVVVKSHPGFLVNRVLMPYLLEAVTLFEEGYKPEQIDQAAESFGMPMGPMTLADTVGVDICQHVADNLARAFSLEVPDTVKNMSADGQLGKKSGKGFYQWIKGSAKKDKKTEKPSPARGKEMTDRMIYRYLNECIACLDEGIVNNPHHLDGALIFGTGFAPFRGGPLNYIRDTGPQDALMKLAALQDKFGDRFKPASGWSEIEKLLHRPGL